VLRHPLRDFAAFTLLELITVILIVGILAAMAAGIFSDARSRAEKAGCVSNLKNLYVGTAAYVQDQGHWPQVDPAQLQTADIEYAKAWMAALEKYGLKQPNWLCPSNQRLLNNPDMTNPKNIRIDYLATPFDEETMTPYKWPLQPWFIERGAVHPGGNLIIFTNGQISTLTEAYHMQQQ
jgi:prepilin-type N-terminal cleavage/methylation domain-containing protein